MGKKGHGSMGEGHGSTVKGHGSTRKGHGSDTFLPQIGKSPLKRFKR